MECPRGWILTKNDAGFDVPFFVKIRNSDIFYPSNISSKFYQAGTLDAGVDDGLFVLTPSQSYIMRVAGWDCCLSNNETFEIAKEFQIGESCTISDEMDMLRIDVSLPWKVSTKHTIDINIYKECVGKDLILSQLNIVKDTPSDTEDIQHLMIEVYKHDGSLFEESCLENPDYVNSKFTITIRGTTQLGEFSHIDDYGNIGFTWEATSGSVSAKNIYTKTQIDEIVYQLRKSIENGEVINPSKIIDLADNIAESNVLKTGFVLDIDEGSQTGLSEEDELLEKTETATMMETNL